MKSRKGDKTLWGARVSEKVECDIIQLKDMDTKQTADVCVRFVEDVEDGYFSELDIISINRDNTVVFTWAEKKPEPLKTKA